MTKNNNNAAGSNAKTPKRRWYQNIADAYKVTARTYPWLGWVMASVVVVIIAVAVLLGVLTSTLIWAILMGIMLALLADTFLLSMLLRPAMYSQLDGTIGAVYSVISQIKRGWVISEEPVQVSKDQDLVWRLVGRPGIVLISEGPRSRVNTLLNNERKKVNRIVTNAPVIFIQCGHEEGQVPLAKLDRKLKRLKKTLTKQEVPAVAARLNAVGSKGLPIPKGVDPYNTRVNRRAMRGK